MKIRPYINYIAAVLLLSACKNYTDEYTQATFTVGDEDNEIVLLAGVKDGGTSVTTRAEVDPDHGKHTPFTSETKMALRIDGTWLEHTPSSSITRTTKAIITSNKVKDNHNEVTFDAADKCYWDDYGTADPANMKPHSDNGRDKGLTIYAACVEGRTEAPLINSWTQQHWFVGNLDNGVIDQSTSGWKIHDLLTSNNITASADGTYKFDDWMNTSGASPAPVPSNILIFTHAMTRITVNLKAGEGFEGYTTSPESAKFAKAPSVTLKSFNYIGIVDIEGKTSTATQANYSAVTSENPAATADIKMKSVSGGKDQNTATFDALVFPENKFTATIANDADKTPSSNDIILELNADDNIYKVTAAQLVKAIVGTSTLNTPVSGTLEQGKNYIINILVNKTKIEVTATIKKWDDVESEEAKPKINVTATYGYTVDQGGTGVSAFTNNYDLFRSTDKATGYDEDSETAGINPAARYTASSSSWDKAIYWPNHQTHYFFRGVYPQVGATASGTSEVGAEAVTTVNSNDVIAVANAKYTTATYPSDLAIAIPRGTTAGSYDETCKVVGHSSTPGICATEGIINMNFEYAMSKVEVRLKSSKEDAGHIALTNANTKVEIVRGYSKARIKLSDGLHDTYADSDKGTYALSNLETPATDFLVTTLDAIVPQEIGDDVIFRITVTDNNSTPDDTSDDKTDVYECKVNLINVKNSSPATPVTEWIHGKHYIYELDLNKTAIKVTATLKDWVTVTASDNIWF